MSDKPATKLDSNIVRRVVGVSFIFLGILFLIGRYAADRFNIDFGHYNWPFFIIMPGLLMFFASFALESRAGISLAIFGGVTAMTGFILLFQNTLDLFASWAYAWALVAPTSVGLARLVYGGLRGLGDQVRTGLNQTGIGLAIFVFGAFFFELGIGVSGLRFGAAWLCWPGLFIGLGIILLLSGLLPRPNHHSHNDERQTQGD